MEDDVTNFAHIIDKLFHTFSGVVERDVIAAVVISYDGDVDQSANAIMSMTGDINTSATVSQEPSQVHHENKPHTPDAAVTSKRNMITIQSMESYSQISKKITQNVQNKPQSSNKTTHIVINNMNEIMTQCNNRWRVLFLMRGPPGCGKTHLARELLKMTIGHTQLKDPNTHILSADDYFMSRGVYHFDKYKLQNAHVWNHCRAKAAMARGISPLFIDNTNIEPWEMEPYVRAGVSNGYMIHVIDPITPWAKNANQLSRRNTHNVPIHTIKRMVENMQEGLTGDMLIKSLGLHYPVHFTPPVLRQYPELSPPPLETCNSVPLNCTQSERNYHNQQNKKPTHREDSNTNISVPDCNTTENCSFEPNEKLSHFLNANNETEVTSSSNLTTEVASADVHSKDHVEIEKRLEEIQKLELEWDNGDKWEEEPQKVTILSRVDKPTISNAVFSEPSFKPPRKRVIQKLSKDVTEQCFIPKADTNDWSKFLTLETQAPTVLVERNTSVAEKVSSSTCIELGDMDIPNAKGDCKVITTVPRDINIFTVERKEKIPIQRMFDKGTTTSNEIISMQPFRCQNEEQHFKAFRKMFSNVRSTELRDIFENCCGDVNWAVEIVIDGMTNNQFRSVQDEVLSEDEENAENVAQCECLAAYNIIPDHRAVVKKKDPKITRASTENTPSASPRRGRREATVSDATLQLRRQIEENIVISENHYSQHHLKVKNARNGELFANSAVCSAQENQQTADHAHEANLPSTSGVAGNTRDEVLHQDASDDEENSWASDDQKTININVGMDFIKQLDGLYGRDDMTYPQNIEAKLNVPLTLLNEINALWMESMMHQFEKDSRQTQEMIEQDAGFARLLVAKEEEMLLDGKEPEVPDFKEIMDLDLALSLYQRDVSEWRSKMPLDLAAKMSRDKLYNLFPDVAPDVLTELLVAHDNNFQQTVEVLLVSTGRSEVLGIKNGINKFIMEREMERKKRQIEEQRKALSEVEWPLLPMDSNLRMEDVDRFRREASDHLAVRESNYRKAQDYIQRGMLSVASYYSELAAFHTKLYEQANSKAANSLVYVNAQRSKDNATLDLHCFRVAEARQSLDLFLDIHIRKLKEINGRNGVTAHTLFLLTGRGKHSPAGPKVKPAVVKRLQQRGFAFYELNPGLLAARVTAAHCLSDEI